MRTTHTVFFSRSRHLVEALQMCREYVWCKTSVSKLISFSVAHTCDIPRALSFIDVIQTQCPYQVLKYGLDSTFTSAMPNMYPINVI